jgi:hypothetical protein
MFDLPIASLFVRDAMEQQFERRPAARGRPAAGPRGVRRTTAAAGARPADVRFSLRSGVARTLRRLADRLEPPGVSPGAVPRAHPAGRRDSPC